MCFVQDTNLGGADVQCTSQLVDVGTDIFITVLLSCWFLNIFLSILTPSVGSYSLLNRVLRKPISYTY